MVLAIFIAGGLFAYLIQRRNDIIEVFQPEPTLVPTQSAADLALRALLYVRDGEFDNAIEAYERVIEIAPERIDNYRELIDLLVQTDQPEKALMLTEEALAIEPDNDQLFQVKAAAHLKNGERLEAIGEDSSAEYSRAVEAGRAAVRLNPNNLRAHAYIGAGLIRQDISNVVAAYEAVETALLGMERLMQDGELASADKVILYHYAEVQINGGFYDDAEQRLLEAYDIDPGYTDAAIALAQINFFFRNNQTTAIDVLTRALEENPKNAVLLDTMSYFQLVAGNAPEAEQYGRQAVEANQDMVRARSHYGWALYKNNNYPDAIKELRIATESYGEPDPINGLYFALLGLSLAYEDTENCDEAIQIFDSVLSTSAEFSPGYDNAEFGKELCRDAQLSLP